MKTFRLLTALLLTGLFLATAQADDSAQDRAWKQSAVIYLLAPTIRGTSGIGPVDGDVDIDPKSVFDSLEGAFLGVYAAEKGRWGVLADVIYMDLGAKLEGDREILSGKLNNEQFNLALAATYRLSEQWQVLGGGMYTDLSLKLVSSLLRRDLKMVADDGTLHPDPDVSMKVYADTGQVEVLDIKNQQRLPLQGLYQMPGLQQKWQANLFLGNWLSYCFKSGYRFCIDNRNDPGSLVEKTAEIA